MKLPPDIAYVIIGLFGGAAKYATEVLRTKIFRVNFVEIVATLVVGAFCAWIAGRIVNIYQPELAFPLAGVAAIGGERFTTLIFRLFEKRIEKEAGL